jgi:hypothetical protein
MAAGRWCGLVPGVLAVWMRDGLDGTALWCLHVTRRADDVWRVQSVKKTKTCGPASTAP